MALALGTAALLAGCGAARSPTTVVQYLAQCSALKGKLVSVAGYIGECGGYSCIVYRDRSGPAQERRHIGETNAAVYRQRDGLPRDGAAITAKPAMIGVGSSPAFDRKAQDFQNRYVVITGLVDSQNCTGAGGTDRSAGLHPTDIRAWTSSDGAPKGGL